MALQILYYPDPRLREVSPAVADIESVKPLIAPMFEVMYRSRGIGLAGPQVGILQRIIVANITGKREEADEEKIFLNPTIVDRSGEMRDHEGCLSLPGIDALIRRSESLAVEVTDLEGRRQRFEATGLWSKLFQHEIDHLDGILILDKMSPADLKQWAYRLKELEDDFRKNVRREHKPAEAGL
ncbi:MAG: peptide deformylase [Planctomycetes bacterium]|nr:peptide deformylase [Planctomycetota bacterium]